MDIWKHLLVDGEYSDRRRVLSGLDLKHIAARPPGVAHTIYEELWHITKWQDIVLSRDGDRRRAWIEGSRFPSVSASIQEAEWHALVEEFLKDLDTAIENARSAVEAGKDDREKVTFHEELACLAVHNAYHLGKIVAVRQQLGCWPVPG